MDRIINTSSFNGVKLLGGEEANGFQDLVVHVGAGDGLQENTDTITINIDNIKLDVPEILGLGMESEVGPMEPDEEFERTTAAEKLATLDIAIKRVAGNRAVLGAKQSRLDSTIRNLGVQIENFETSRSRIKDVDFASETASFAQNRILGQSGTSILAQANTIPQMVIGLLQ